MFTFVVFQVTRRVVNGEKDFICRESINVKKVIKGIKTEKKRNGHNKSNENTFCSKSLQERTDEVCNEK